MRLLNALNSEDRGLKVRFSLAKIAFDRESAQMCQTLSSQGKNAPSNPHPHYLVRLATSRLGFSTGEKRVYTTTAGPLFSRSVTRPRGHRAKKAMVYAIFLGKQGKRVYTTGPERRVYTIEPQTRKKKKRRVSTVVV